MRHTLLIAITTIAFAIVASAQTRYCNPLPMPVGRGGVASGDVSVFYDEGKYYMYCTGGGAWVSEDMMNWEFHFVDHVPIAPDVVKYNGKYYMSGNDIGLYVSDSPIGPFTYLGDFHNTDDPKYGWKVPFDSHIFVDDDNTPYLFWPGRGRTGIYGVELDKNDLTKFVSRPVHLFSFDKTHWFEHMGEHNEYENTAWIEGPWVTKRNGIYYCAYSCSGTQWKTYATGYYTATSPLGPYHFAPNNPLMRNTEGIVTGPAHGSVVIGPDGEYWAFYTVVLSRGGRRIAMDRVEFDEYGNMSIKVTDTPQPAPGQPLLRSDERKSIPLTVGKIGGMAGGNRVAGASSEQPGFWGAYAVDDWSGTIWKPSPEDKMPSLTIELSPATALNVIDLYKVDGLRILFGNGERGTGGMFAPVGGLPVYRYKLEGSLDGEHFFTLIDKTDNNEIKDTVYDDCTPTECRYVRLTVTDWPEGISLGIIEATVFGKYSSSLAPEDPQENDRFLFNY